MSRDHRYTWDLQVTLRIMIRAPMFDHEEIRCFRCIRRWSRSASRVFSSRLVILGLSDMTDEATDEASCSVCGWGPPLVDLLLTAGAQLLVPVEVERGDGDGLVWLDAGSLSGEGERDEDATIF